MNKIAPVGSKVMTFVARIERPDIASLIRDTNTGATDNRGVRQSSRRLVFSTKLPLMGQSVQKGQFPVALLRNPRTCS
jgi:hypothetical protein